MEYIGRTCTPYPPTPFPKDGTGRVDREQKTSVSPAGLLEQPSRPSPVILDHPRSKTMWFPSIMGVFLK